MSREPATAEMVEIEVHFVRATKAQATEIVLPDFRFVPPEAKPGRHPIPFGLFAVTGIFTPQQTVETLSRLKKAGAAISSMQRTATLSGHRAQVQNVREFRYPSKYSEPNNDGKVVPVSFRTKPVGISLEFEPKVAGDSITLIIGANIKELTGYSDYTAKKDEDPNTKKSDASPVWQPNFKTREVATEVTLYSGQTVLLAETEEKSEDRGHFIFITARVIITP